MFQQTQKSDDSALANQSPWSVAFWALFILHAVLMIGFVLTRGTPIAQQLLLKDAKPAWSTPADFMGEGWPMPSSSAPVSSASLNNVPALAPEPKIVKPTMQLTRISQVTPKGNVSLLQLSGNVTPNADFDAYDKYVKEVFLALWKPPTAEAGTRTSIRMSISLGGIIQSAELIKASGDLSFDTSVRDALTKIDNISKPMPLGLEGAEYVLEAIVSME